MYIKKEKIYKGVYPYIINKIRFSTGGLNVTGCLIEFKKMVLKSRTQPNTLLKCRSCGYIQTLKQWEAKKNKVSDCCIKCFMRTYIYMDGLK